jgi:hypothetical protein
MRLPPPVPELPVGDIQAAADFYARRMAFRIDWTYEGWLASISRDDARIFLRRRDAPETVRIWLNLDSPAEVDALHAEWKARDVPMVEELQTTPYNLRQFVARDLDGNTLRVFHDLGTR